MKNGSLPVRECGLKFRPAGGVSCLVSVTPRAGVWIEISTLNLPFLMSCVTPRAGVWIEIQTNRRRVMEREGHSPCGSVD